MDAGAFLLYLDAVFNVVIGIEFMKMLCKPSSANIIEVLIFLIARHMIVTSTTPLEDLLSVLSIGVGIEFMKMLCKPSSANIIEVLIFLIARHMIVTSTTPLEDLLSVLSIGVLFFFRRFMLMTKPDKKQHVPNLLGAIKTAQSPEFRSAVIKAEEELLAEEAKKAEHAE